MLKLVILLLETAESVICLIIIHLHPSHFILHMPHVLPDGLDLLEVKGLRSIVVVELLRGKHAVV